MSWSIERRHGLLSGPVIPVRLERRSTVRTLGDNSGLIIEHGDLFGWSAFLHACSNGRLFDGSHYTLSRLEQHWSFIFIHPALTTHIVDPGD